MRSRSEGQRVHERRRLHLSAAHPSPPAGGLAPAVPSRGGTPIALTGPGPGPALVLVDGAMCYSGAGPMPALAERLTDHFTVYLFGRRGRGESGDTPPFAVEREIEDLAALVDHAGG